MDAAPRASKSGASTIVQHRLRRGGPDFKFALRGERDRFTPDYVQRFGTYSYGYQNLLLTAEGKIGIEIFDFLRQQKRRRLLTIIGSFGAASAFVMAIIPS